MKKLTFVLVLAVLTLGLSVAAQAFYMDFEEGLGNDGGLIAGVPGVTFTASSGTDWAYLDHSTGSYNTNSIDLVTGSGAYQMYGNVAAWLGVSQDWGRIDFDDQTGTWFQVGVTSTSAFYVEAYDINDNLIDVATLASSNIYGSDMAFLRVDAPANNTIAWVKMHDSGNYWLADNMSGDARGGFEAVPEPSTLLLLGGGLIGLAGFRRKFKV